MPGYKGLFPVDQAVCCPFNQKRSGVLKFETAATANHTKSPVPTSLPGAVLVPTSLPDAVPTGLSEANKWILSIQLQQPNGPIPLQHRTVLVCTKPDSTGDDAIPGDGATVNQKPVGRWSQRLYASTDTAYPAAHPKSRQSSPNTLASTCSSDRGKSRHVVEFNQRCTPSVRSSTESRFDVLTFN